MPKNIRAQVVGGAVKDINDLSEGATLQDLADKMGLKNHSATVNGEPADMSDELNDYNFVTFAPQVKGA